MWPLGLCALAIGATGCVPKANYERCLNHAESAKAAADARDRDSAARIQTLEQSLAEAQAATQDCESKASDLSTSDHNLQSRLDEATAINQQLRDELVRLGKDVDKILTERGTLSKALDDAKSRLEELRKAQANAEARTALFRDFERRFKPLIDAGQVQIETRRGELVMIISGDWLFDPGKTDLRSAAKGSLMEIAHAIQTTSPPATGRRFLVTASIDTPEAKAGRRAAKSSWEVTSARSVAVVEYLVSLGVPPTSLTAAAAGSFDAIAAGDAPGDRAKNRRVEIALLPSEADGPSTSAAK